MEWPDFPAALIFHCSLLGKLTWWDFLFFFKYILNIHKIQVCTSKVWTCEYFHLGEKLWPYLLLPGSVRISCKNPDTFFVFKILTFTFVFYQGWKIVLWKHCGLCPTAEKSWGLLQLDRPFPTVLLHTQRMIRTEVNLQLNLIHWKQCLEEWWLAATLAVLLSTCLSLQVCKLLYFCFTLGESGSN